MDMLAWILLCLFASIGIVQCCVWLTGARKASDRLWRGYYVVPLCGDCEKLEAEIRQAASQIRWSCSGCEPVLLVETGLCEEAQTICRAMAAETGCAVVCTREELAEALGMQDGAPDTE